MLRDQFDVSDVPCVEEDAARLRGVMAMLALPAVRTKGGAYRRRDVEIEVAPDQWERIDGVSIESERVTFHRGTNGTRREWVFLRIERMPEWRVDAVRPLEVVS